MLLADSLGELKPVREIINEVKEVASKDGIQEHETVCIIWNTVMDIPEWSKKEVMYCNDPNNWLSNDYSFISFLIFFSFSRTDE